MDSLKILFGMKLKQINVLYFLHNLLLDKQNNYYYR